MVGENNMYIDHPPVMEQFEDLLNKEAEYRTSLIRDRMKKQLDFMLDACKSPQAPAEMKIFIPGLEAILKEILNENLKCEK